MNFEHRQKVFLFLFLFLDIVKEISCDDVTGFEIAVGGTNLLKLKTDGYVSVNLVFESGGTNLTLQAGLDIGTNLNTTTAVIDESAKTISYNIDQSYMEDVNFGTYLLTFNLTPSSGQSATKEVVIFYQEPIVGFSVNRDQYLPLDEEVIFEVTLTNGSNLETEWFLDTNETVLLQHDGQPRSMKLNFTFTVPGMHNVTVVAANTVSRTFDSIIVYAYYRLNGFNVTVKEELIASLDQAEFSVQLSDNATFPMGTLKLNVSYGDGIEENAIDLGSLVSVMQNEGHTLIHSYPRQGNYTFLAVIYSEIDSLNFTIDVYVWDNITTTLDLPTAAKVGESIQLNFIDPTLTGFTYTVDFGDGGTPESNSDNNSVWYTYYIDKSFTHTYSDSGAYTVTLEASNQIYSRFSSYVINVQHPLPGDNVTLSPVSDIIPLPDGEVEFTLSLVKNLPTPTNVTCSYDFGEGIPYNKSTVIQFGADLIMTVLYNISSDKNVVINCWNLVSTIIRTSSISVRNFTLDDFLITYESPIAINTSIGNQKDETYPFLSHIYKVEDVPTAANFSINLLDCSRMPPSMTFKWDFGDGTIEEEETTSLSKEHQYTKRDNYTVKLTITDGNGNSVNKQYNITIGIANISVTPLEGIIGSTIFTFTISGATNYVFDTSAPHKYLISNTGHIFSLQYTEWGVYHECVTAIHGDVLEEVCLLAPVEVDYDIADAFDVTVSNVTVSLPPGEINITISDLGSEEKPYINYTIDMKDPIDTDVGKGIVNISSSDPLIYTRGYKSLGTFQIEINCTNLVTSYGAFVDVEVVNDCFEPGGMFDRQFADHATPMKAYTSSDVVLSNRMQVRCDGVTFHWTVHRVEIVNDEPSVTALLLTDTSGGAIRMARGSISEGLISVTLVVESVDPFTRIEETMYLEFKKLPPIAFIKGGSKRSVRFEDQNVTLNAIDGSYDSEKGFRGNKSGLVFQWECFKVADLTFQAMEQLLFDDNHRATPCSVTETSQGIVVLDLTRGTDTQGYILTVYVIDGSLNTSYTQLLKVIPGNPPDVVVKCTINCKEKIAVTSPVNLRADCVQCDTGKVVEYDWSLSLYDETTKTYTVDTGFESKTTTGLNKKSMVINAGSLLPGRKYSLQMQANYLGESQKTTQISDMYTNYPPYNGSCKSDELVYKAPLDRVDITCKDWTDEGSFTERDLVRDQASSEPLSYLYETRTRRLDASNNEELVAATLYKGGESSVKDMAVQVGDANFNYLVELRVLVFDRFGDSEAYSINVTVKPDDAVAGTPNDTEAVSQMFTDFDDVVRKTKAGGNSMEVIGLCGSMASVLGPVDSSADSTSSSSNSTNGTEVTVASLYQNKTKGLANTLKDAVVNERTMAVMQASDAQKITRNMEAIVGNPQFITDDVALNGAEVSAQVIDKVRNISRTEPFPVEELLSIDGAVEGTMATVDKVLSSIMPGEIVDVDEVFSVDSLYDDLLAEEQDNITMLQASGNFTDGDLDNYKADLRQRAEVSFNEKTRKVGIMRQKAASANDSVPLLMDSLGGMYDVKLKLTEVGAKRSELKRDSVKMGVEKVTLDILTARNGSEEPLDGVKLAFELNETDSEGSAIEIKQAVFEKPPFIGGGGVATLTSKAVQVDVDDNRVIPSAAIPNKETVQARRVRPVYTSNDPEGMFYIMYEIQNEGDSTLIYVNPDDLDPSGNGGTSFHLYVQADTFPTASSNVFNQRLTASDWEGDYGMKVLLPPLTRGKKYLGFKPYSVASTTTSVKRRRKRSATIQATTSAPDNATEEQASSNVSLVITTTGCRSWNEDRQSWVSDGCIVLPFSTINETVCRCPREKRGIIFATTFYVPPNTIDFSTVFSKFDLSNASVYGTCIAIIVIWLLAVIYLRRKDKQDRDKWAVYFLDDSDASDTYFYLITVDTGMRRGAGTKSKVKFVLTGEEADSGVRNLDDGKKKGFPSGSVRKFFMGTKDPLGPLTYLRIWHDNSGDLSLQSWYLNQVTVDDLQKQERYVFLCERWLALEEDDGHVERVLPVSGKENLSNINTLFYQHAQFNITENHLWLSVLMRPKRSSFSRVQRASCILALLFLTMISNAMFFRSSSDDPSADTVSLGALKFSSGILFVSLIGILITTPPIVIVTMIFKKCKPKPRPSKPNPLSEAETETDTDSNVLHTDETENKSKKQKKEKFDGEEYFAVDHLPLPYWTAYIAWVIIFLAVVSSAFFLLLYSMQWGKSKSEEWLSSFVFSFVESLFCVDPLKVVVLAMVFSILFRRPVEDKPPKVDVEKLRQASGTVNAGTTRKCTPISEEIDERDMPSPREMERMRVRRQQELRASGILVELIVYGIVVFCICGISYINRDHRSYYMKDYLENQLYYASVGETRFENVNGIGKWHQWMTETVLPAYFPLEYYNGQALGARERLFFGDVNNVRVGPSRLRQVRMKRSSCDTEKVTYPYPCVKTYGQYSQDETDYCEQWTPYPGSKCADANQRAQDKTLGAWTYTDAAEIWGVPAAGEYSTYAGGGYILELFDNSVTSKAQVDKLLQNSWIDRGTRAVILEFTLYTANANLFLFVQFLAEFPETGGAFTWRNIQAFRPISSLGGMGAFSLVCYAVYLINMIYMTVRPILKIKKHGCRNFIRDVWNIIDLIITFLSYSLIVIFGFRMSYANRAMKKYYEELAKPNDEKDYINFQHIVIWDSVFNIILAILVFIITLRVLRILGYNRKLTEVASVVSHASTELIGFIVVFGVIFSAYMSLGYLLFGVNLEEYKSLFAAWGTLTNTLIGLNSFNKMVTVSPLFAQFYYFTFVFCVLMTLATMFAAILNKSISEVKNETKNVEDEFGVFDFVFKSLKNIIGVAWKPNNNEPNSTGKTIYKGRTRGRKRRQKKRVTYKPFDDV